MIEKSREPRTIAAVRPFEKIEMSKTCPSCSSVFVTKKECESCGLQFWVDLVGEPFGERSFFVMREDFYLNKPFYTKFFPKQNFERLRLVKKYRRSLLKRFEVLTGYFFDEVDEDISRRKVFLFEAKQIITEFASLGGNLSALWALVDRGEKHPLAASLYLTLKEVEAEGSFVPEFGQSFSISEIFKRSLFREFLLAAFAVITAALIVFRYLTTY